MFEQNTFINFCVNQIKISTIFYNFPISYLGYADSAPVIDTSVFFEPAGVLHPPYENLREQLWESCTQPDSTVASDTTKDNFCQLYLDAASDHLWTIFVIYKVESSYNISLAAFELH